MTGVGEIKAAVASARSTGESIGLVPTMGGLHEGHLSLIRRAREDNDKVIVTVFVNPAQFGPGEDFGSYPRDLKRDTELAAVAGADIIFAPDNETIYPEGFSTFVEVEGLTDGLCGAARPEHFRGVITVCAKLFHIVGADRAYFGEKDAQQFRVIKRMAVDLNMPIEIVPCPIIREDDGLAMSSRNVYLAPSQREQAVCLYDALQKAKALYDNGERKPGKIISAMERIITSAKDARIDYISIVDDETLEEIEEISGPVLVALGVFFGVTRLIDNIVLR